MRLLPDRNIKANYKKRYDANYEKLMAYRHRRAEQKAEKSPLTVDNIKQRALGAAVFGVLVFILCMAGTCLSGIYEDKQAEIALLESQITDVDTTIKEYQVINSEEKYQQIADAIVWIEDLQTQYVTNDFRDTFDAYAERYLGDYNSNWAKDIKTVVDPVWKGYLDSSGDLRTSVDMLFILYSNAAPVMAVRVSYSIDGYGNLGTMTYCSKAAFV